MADVALRAPGASASPPTARGRGGADRVERHPLVFDQLRIENTNHCGYRCFMCPREQQTRASGFMPIEDLAFVYERIGPDHEGEIHLHGFGEPLLDKRLIDKVALTRARYPKAFIKFFTILGVKVEDGTFERLARAGISNLQISFYVFTAESYAKVTGTRTLSSPAPISRRWRKPGAPRARASRSRCRPGRTRFGRNGPRKRSARAGNSSSGRRAWESGATRSGRCTTTAAAAPTTSRRPRGCAPWPGACAGASSR